MENALTTRPQLNKAKTADRKSFAKTAKPQKESLKTAKPQKEGLKTANPQKIPKYRKPQTYNPPPLYYYIL